MPIDNLTGWTRIVDLPLVTELNHFLAKRDAIGRDVLIKVANNVPGYRVPSHFKTDFGMVHGLTFLTKSGSILLLFPAEWPTDPSQRVARLYTMGNTTAVDYCRVGDRFHDELERFLLPAEAHAGDGG